MLHAVVARIPVGCYALEKYVQPPPFRELPFDFIQKEQFSTKYMRRVVSIQLSKNYLLNGEKSWKVVSIKLCLQVTREMAVHHAAEQK